MTRSRFQFTLRQLFSAITVVAISCAILYSMAPIALSYMLTGHAFPISKIDKLKSPVAVAGWDSDGLILSDGRNVPLRNIGNLPQRSAALSEVTRSGVEITADGCVYGLVRIHHWCGNDPVRTHIVRVDISDWLTFLKVGDAITPKFEDIETVRVPGGALSAYGWEIGEYLLFRLAVNSPEESGG
jgi:hypothetical protein